MAKICSITGSRTSFGNNVSHADNKTRRRWEPNLQRKRIWSPSEKRFIRMHISARGLRTMQKGGVEGALAKVRKG
jgi:large subunit ribosomal protein L28